MKISACLLGLATLCLSALGAAADDEQADTSDDADAARALFERAVLLAERGQWESALRHYQRSHAVKPAPETRYSIGVAQLNTGRLVAARASFRAFLRDTEPDPESERFRSAATRALRLVGRRIGRVTIHSRHDSTIELDGAPIAVGTTRLVDPGMHVAVVTAPGFLPLTRTIVVEEGERLQLALALEPRPRDARGGAPSFAPLMLLVGGSALFTVGVTVGVVGIAQADGAVAESRRAEDARDLALAGDVLGTVGLCAAGIGLVWWLVAESDGDQEGAGASSRGAPWTDGGLPGVAVTF
jgi:tetratricopeptide (TPR) repeat protein